MSISPPWKNETRFRLTTLYLHELARKDTPASRAVEYGDLCGGLAHHGDGDGGRVFAAELAPGQA